MSIVESCEFGSGGNDLVDEEEDFAATTTVKPFFAKVTAICLPIPLEAPMTMTMGDGMIIEGKERELA